MLCGCLTIASRSTHVTLAQHQVTQDDLFAKECEQHVAWLMHGINLCADDVDFLANLGFLGFIPIGKMEENLVLNFERQIACILRQCWMGVEVALDFSRLLYMTVGFRVLDKFFEFCKLTIH